MEPAPDTATTLRMHDRVRLTRDVDDVPAGAVGAIVLVFDDVFGVELDDPELTARIDGIVDVSGGDLELVERFT